MASKSGEEPSPSNSPTSSPDEDFATDPLDFSIKIQQNANAMVCGILNLSAHSPDPIDVIVLDSRDDLGENNGPKYQTYKY